MEVKEYAISKLTPYENNPRKNDGAVEAVANSIKEFGFKQPIVIDKDGVIVAGHTRYKAAMQLGLASVPCVIADDLTEEQIKAFRLADNKTADLASWDFWLLEEELEGISNISMADFGFEFCEDIDIDSLFIQSDKKENKKEKTIKCPFCGEIITL